MTHPETTEWTIPAMECFLLPSDFLHGALDATSGGPRVT